MALPAPLAETLLDNDVFTEDEYFEWEARTPGKWEFVPEGPPDAFGRYTGTIQAKSGSTPDHSITANLIRTLGNALHKSGNRTCRVFSPDLKVRAGDGRKSYPDVSVICGPPQMYRKRRDVVTNPLLVAEVLSPATEGYDCGDKWASYQTIPSLQHALLLATDRARVEVYTRDRSGWRYQAYGGLDATLELSALGVSLSLADMYDLIEFE